MTLDTKQELVISQNIGGQLQVSANVNKPKKTDRKIIILYIKPCIHTYKFVLRSYSTRLLYRAIECL